MPLQKAEALFHFKPTASVELELKKGDVVVVRRTSVGEGWWEGEINGKRGLFPSSFVKMLPTCNSAEGSPVKDRMPPPLTPGSSKKAFMETLLTPSTNVQDQLYDGEKASDIFVQGHSEISISAGPRWDCFPPTLTIVIKDLHTESRFSGVKHFTVFDVETKQLGTQVTRRYKNFLWLYDKMAELFPCISLPPLPVKQFSGVEEHGIEARRRGLENFLNRVANHPVLGSTKLLRDFLVEKDDKDWKIGRHVSHVKVSKTGKKLFTAPIYCTVKYPPFNVPINQLPSIEKFSRFSRVMELQIQALQNTCQQLCHSSRNTMSVVNMLGKDFQMMAKGAQPVSAGRRKMTPTHNSNLSVPNGHTSHHSSGHQRIPSDIEEEESDGEMDDSFEWNWRDDSKFNCMMSELYDVAGTIRKLASLHQDHQESLERNVVDALAEYVGIIHTLPTLVRLHDEAMETYKISQEKDTRKEAEEMRQHCETLNNIVLAEFDYYSKTMVNDFETIILNLLKEQATYHRQVAKSWDSLYEGYINRRSSRLPQEAERITSSGKTFSFGKSGSFTGSFPSSRVSSGSFDISVPTSPTESTPVPSEGSTFQSPSFITVEKMDPARRSDSWERIDDSMIVGSPQNESLLATSHQSNSENHDLYESVVVHQLQDNEIVVGRDKKHHSYANINFQPLTKDTPETHSYANISVMQGTSYIVSKPKSAPNSPKKPKKPIPIRRKQDSESLTSSQELTTSTESNSSPTNIVKLPKKPLPPAKPNRPSVSSPEDRPSFTISTPALNQLPQKSVTANIDKPLPVSVPPNSTSPLFQKRERSKTSLESGGSEKKLPMLPPLKPLREFAKTTDNLPALQEREPPPLKNTSVTHPSLKSQLSEPIRNKVQIGDSNQQPGASETNRTKVLASAGLNRTKVQTGPNVADSATHTGREELMRKLSLRRQRLEEQLGAHKVTTHKSNMGNISETSSERNSISSTTSTEVVVKYSTREEPSHGAVQSSETGTGNVLLRKHVDDDSLAKFGIIEDTEGGSFVI